MLGLGVGFGLLVILSFAGMILASVRHIKPETCFYIFCGVSYVSYVCGFFVKHGFESIIKKEFWQNILRSQNNF